MAIFLCITLHEFGHALVARKYNCKTRSITLLPIGGVASMEAIPENPKEELHVALAGPLVNLVIASFLYLGFLVFGNTMPAFDDVLVIGSHNFLFVLMYANFFIALFNMIPAFPMDGGRVLRAVLATRLSRTKATRITSVFAQVIAVLFILLGFIANFFLIIIGLFILITARSEWFLEHSRFMLQEHTVKDILIRHFKKMDASTSLDDAIKYLLNATEDHFLVMEDAKVVGSINRDILLKALEDNDPGIPIKEIMDKSPRILHPDDRLSDVYNPQKGSLKSGYLMPVMKNEELLGVLDFENISEFIQVKTSLLKRKEVSIGN
ncbi:site-2 protease family protein [Reichenbachiella sp. MALMAid0571]|uniref:site-2 protease family protein n=1 Tax=Reichenbachiella sp. MALMAid0571 TaxID=3143939 RepID=UPI0032DF737B